MASGIEWVNRVGVVMVGVEWADGEGKSLTVWTDEPATFWEEKRYIMAEAIAAMPKNEMSAILADTLESMDMPRYIGLQVRKSLLDAYNAAVAA